MEPFKRNRTLTARKNHSCDFCEKPILKGTVYNIFEGKFPKYNSNPEDPDDFTQIGIDFVRCRSHTGCKIYD